MTAKPNSKGIEATAEVQAAVKAFIARAGDETAAEGLGVSVQTMARVAAGMKVNRTTLEVVRTRLGIKEAS